MAKKRRKKSSKCPEPFNTLIDLAAAATLDYVAYKRRQKRGGSKTKIDPYAAAGAAYGMGLIDDTEDLIKLGGMLGAMGAFDDDDKGSYTPAPTNNRNKYAWRMNCEDGSDYGIYPENYETRQEYNEAVHDQFKDYQLALYMLGFSSFLEVMLLENYDADFLSGISAKLDTYSLN